MPQIDYTIEKLNTSPNEVQDQIINFQKQYIWKEKRHDYLSMWLEIEQLEQDVEKFNRNEIERENNIHNLLLFHEQQNIMVTKKESKKQPTHQNHMDNVI